MEELKLDEEEGEESDDEEEMVRKINHLDNQKLSSENVSSRNISKIKKLGIGERLI